MISKIKLYLVAVVAITIIIDIFVINRYGNDSSISAVVIGLSYKYPFFVFLVGFVSGHLFWRARIDDKQTKEK